MCLEGGLACGGMVRRATCRSALHISAPTKKQPARFWKTSGFGRTGILAFEEPKVESQHRHHHSDAPSDCQLLGPTVTIVTRVARTLADA